MTLTQVRELKWDLVLVNIRELSRVLSIGKFTLYISGV